MWANIAHTNAHGRYSHGSAKFDHISCFVSTCISTRFFLDFQHGDLHAWWTLNLSTCCLTQHVSFKSGICQQIVGDMTFHFVFSAVFFWVSTITANKCWWHRQHQLWRDFSQSFPTLRWRSQHRRSQHLSMRSVWQQLSWPCAKGWRIFQLRRVTLRAINSSCVPTTS